MEAGETWLPQARAEGLTSEAMGDELVVYDHARHRCHALNRTASLVWRCCDGQTTVAEMAGRLQNDLGLPADEGLVWLALRQLDRAHLLQDRLGQRAQVGEGSRRELLRRLALTGGLTLLLPVITSIVAPTPAMAATCPSDCTGLPHLTPCGPPDCTGICSSGSCIS